MCIYRNLWAILCLWLWGGCGALHQVTTFSFSRNPRYFCFLLSLRRAPLVVTAYITQSLDRAVLTSSRTCKISSYLGVFCKAIFFTRLLRFQCHNMAHPGKYFSDRFLLLEDLCWNTLVSMLERPQQMTRGMCILQIYKLSTSRWKRWRLR